LTITGTEKENGCAHHRTR